MYSNPSRGSCLRRVDGERGTQYRCLVEADVLVMREGGGRVPAHPPADTSEQINTMYLETKTNMLRLVEQNLKLRLELQALSSNFHDLLHNFHRFDQDLPITQPKPSATRARVQALYAARRARILNRRSSVQPKETLPPHQRKSLAKAAPCTSTPLVHSRTRKMSDSKVGLTPIDEEKFIRRKHTEPNVGRVEQSECATGTDTTLKSCMSFGIEADEMNDSKVGLAPINEEKFLRRQPTELQSKVGHVGQSESATLLGTDTTLKSCMSFGIEPDQTSLWLECPQSAKKHANRYLSSFDECLENSRDYPENTFRQRGNSLDNTRRWSPMSRSSSSITMSSPRGLGSSASSCSISQLYSPQSLKDISNISCRSKSSVREQPSRSSIDGNFHSTFRFPLHSTMNNPLNSTLNLFGQSRVSEGHYSDDEVLRADSWDSKLLDTRTVMSEPIWHSYFDLGIPNSTPLSAQKDPCRRMKTRRRVSLDKNHNESERASPNVKFSESSMKTPTRKPQATLCKEHGLHPTFGGPCIFKNDDSTSFLSTSSESGDEFKTGSQTLRSSCETDCDSSYLSECVDDSSMGHSVSEVDDITATYDQRSARMRMLRRQTGHTELKKPRHQLGLSESDIYHDVVAKHMSLEATRASLPDLHAMSTSTFSERDESADNTLRASPFCDTNHFSLQDKLSMDPFNATLSTTNSTLILGDLECDVSPCQSSPDHLPLSISTGTTDESPESNNGLSVPVNSPNITDSGGSSSRPATDSCDYVDNSKPDWNLPSQTNTQIPAAPLPERPPCTVGKNATPKDMRTSRRSRSTSHSRGPRSNSSGHSQGAHSLDHQRVSRRSKRMCEGYTPDMDSGFSTQGSCWRGRAGSGSKSKHGDVRDVCGLRRSTAQHDTKQTIQHDRKKALVKKLKRFSNNFHHVSSSSDLHIHTLAHF